MDLSLSGLASGFDWSSMIEQLSEVERAPQKRLRTEQNQLEQRNNAYASLVTQLTVLQSRVETLNDPDLYDGRAGTSSDEDIATVSAEVGAALGTHTLAITQLATTSVQRGTTNAGHRLSDSDVVTDLVLSEASFATAITAGTFTVNGQQITIGTDDTLQEVFDKIATATGDVQGSYSAATDTITLSRSGGGAIVLGSATDTSNFLTVARLHNNGTGTVTSAAALGSIRLYSNLDEANFDTAITDGGSGAGEFKINGVNISFDASNDTVADVLARINNSSAGVTASYDSINDRLVLTNRVTGDLGLALEDVTGNFLAATGLSGGELSRGQNLLFTVDGGGTLTSASNTITAAVSGLEGLSITALGVGSSTIEVTSDTDAVKTAITDFITEYNSAQQMIDSETSSSTDAEGEVTAGTLAFLSEPNEVAGSLRRIVNGIVSGLSGSITQLAALGIESNGSDDRITLADSTALDEALADHLQDIKDLFTREETGIAVQLESYLERTVGEEGSILTLQENLERQIADIDVQIADLEKIVQANAERLKAQFVAMEEAQARINQQMQYLTQYLGTD